ERLFEDDAYCALCLVSRDDLARSEVVNWLHAQSASHGLRIINLAFENAVYTPRDVALRIFEGLPHDDAWEKRRKSYERERGVKTLRDMLVKDLAGVPEPGRLLLLFQDLDAALDDRVRQWVEK